MNYGYHSGNVNTSRAGMSIIDSQGLVREYNTYTSGTVVEFNCSHVHSNNYIFSVDYKNHQNYCPCGYISNNNHCFDIHDDDMGTCKYCSYTDELDFSPSLLTDPDFNTLHGTYVSLYGGSYRETDLCVGFTRILYFENGSPSLSRIDYNWESTNPNIAIVTSYGTVIGLSPGTVNIIATLKSDPRKIGIITITVNPDLSATTYYLSMTTDNRANYWDNGTEVTLLNNQSGLTTIHCGYSRVLGFVQTNVYPSLKDFLWYSSNSSAASVSIYGTIQAKEVAVETDVVITGIYKINHNIKVQVIFTILP